MINTRPNAFELNIESITRSCETSVKPHYKTNRYHLTTIFVSYFENPKTGLKSIPRLGVQKEEQL